MMSMRLSTLFLGVLFIDVSCSQVENQPGSTPRAVSRRLNRSGLVTIRTVPVASHNSIMPESFKEFVAWQQGAMDQAASKRRISKQSAAERVRTFAVAENVQSAPTPPSGRLSVDLSRRVSGSLERNTSVALQAERDIELAEAR